MPTSNTRIERLEEQILQELAAIIYRKVKDPRLGFITLTAVSLSRDLHLATVYYTVLSGQDKNNCERALLSSRGFIKRELAHRLTLFRVPDLLFKYDRSIEQGAKMLALLETVKK